MAASNVKALKPIDTDEQQAPPSLVVGVKDGTVRLNDKVARTAFGTEDAAFIDGAFNQLVQMANIKGELDERTTKFIGSALVEINPKNGLEALLAAQIVANHLVTMKFAYWLNAAESLERIAALEKIFTKLARTTPAQVEALHKLRHGGQQKVTVEHVTVADGGQAIIGNVDGGRGQ
jgi:hypothetical protein